MPIDVDAAVEAASRWAVPSLITRREFLAAITAVERQTLTTAHVRWNGNRRRIVFRHAPTASKARKLQEPCNPHEFDPWQEESETLPSRTFRLICCPACTGEKKVVCSFCVGLGWMPCRECGGGGTAYSYRSGRTIRCPSCRGRGQQKCSCRSGLVDCASCLGRGKVDSWLEVDQSRFDQTRWIDENALSQALASEGSSVQAEWSRSGSSELDIPVEVRHLLQRPDTLGSLDRRTDRLERIEVDLFRADLYRVIYQLYGLAASIEIQGWDLRVVEAPESRLPLLRRKKGIGWGAALMVIAGLVLALGYGLRHPYFMTVPNSLWLGGLAILSGLLVVPLLALWALPRRSGKALAMASLPVLLAIAAQGVLAVTGDPSLDEARALARSGEIEKALFVSSACSDLQIEAEEARQLHDQMQLSRLARIQDPSEAWRATGWTLLTEGGRSDAAEHAIEVTARAAAARQEEGDWPGSETILALAPAEFQSRKAIADLRWQAGAHRVAEIWDIIRSPRPVEERLEPCRWIRRELSFLESFPEPPQEAPVSLAQAEAACARLHAERQREIERQQRAEERERRKKEQAAAAAYRAWARAPLLCRDGMLSPSCVCGQDSRRGCCSHHGGVEGCSRPYPSSTP